MRTILVALGFALLSAAANAGTVEKTTARTAYGQDIVVQINVPENLSGKAPAVVIAPGQGYHMDLPIMQELAEKLASRGIMAYRFNWNYFTKHPNDLTYSKDYVDEIQDMQAVVALAKADARVKADQVVAAGKSLGSLVSYRVFAQDPSLKGLSLLTPVCTSRYDDNDQPLPAPVPSGKENYPGLLTLGRLVSMATSNNDPNCDLPMLFDFLRDANGNIPTIVVGGDHSWNVSRGTDDESMRRNAANRKIGISYVTSWIELLLGR